MEKDEAPYANAINIYISNLIDFSKALDKNRDNPDIVLNLAKIAKQHVTSMEGAAETWTQIRTAKLFNVQNVGITSDAHVQKFTIKE